MSSWVPTHEPTEDDLNTINTEQDIHRFCAYRNHRYGQSREKNLDLLQKMAQVQTDELPWYLDLEDKKPIDTSRARNANGRLERIERSENAGAARTTHTANISTQASANHRAQALIRAGHTADRAPAPMSASVAAGRSPLVYFRSTFKLMRTKPWRRKDTWGNLDPRETATSRATTPGTPEPTKRHNNAAQQPSRTAMGGSSSSPSSRATTKVHQETKASRLRTEAARARATTVGLRGGGLEIPPRSSRRRNVTQSTTGAQGSSTQGISAQQPSGSGNVSIVAGSLEGSNSEPSFFLPDGSQEVGSTYSAYLENQMVSLDLEPVSHGLENTNNHVDVTVGWELEFLVPLEKDVDVPSEALEDGRYFIPEELQSGFTLTEGTPARVHLADILKKAGIPTIPTEFHDPRQAAIAASYLPDPSALDVNDPYATWKVVPEIDCMTIHANLAFDYVGLELNSRKLPANEQGFAELDQVLSLTREHLLVSVTERCGVHTHVDASALDLNEQRHFLCLYLLVEKILFSLCHPRRTRCTWCRPVNVRSYLAVEADNMIAQDSQAGDAGESHKYASHFPEKMRLMHGLIHSLTLDELYKAVRSKGSRNALTLKAVGEDKYTFEFRHFQGSLESAEIRQWTRVCIALVMAAKGLGAYREHPANQVYDVFYQISCRPGDQAWKALLRVLGLADAIHFWELQLRYYPSPQDDASNSDSDSEDKLSPDLHLPRVG